MTEKVSSKKNLNTEIGRIETMINSPQVRDLRSRTRESNGYIRPRNAATLILLKQIGNNTKVLMGKRNKNVKFMPGALVFPGGSVDPFDGSVPVCDELSPTTETRLLSAMRGRPTKRGAKALGVAAIRELSEESGLLLGKSRPNTIEHPNWADFANNSIVPDLSGLRLFSRAITPPGMARRFDTWFFLADADEVGFTPQGGFEPDGELEDLQWIAPEDAIHENTREITRVMLVELIRRLEKDNDLNDAYPAPCYITKGQRFHRYEI